MRKLGSNLWWVLVAVLGGWAYAILAWRRGEPLNSAFILIAALCSYAIGYRFYSKWIAARVLMLNDRRATPCEVHDDGKDFVKTNPWIVFGHHFAAISGPGPLVGPVLAAQFGYLPGTLWILIGVTLGGAVQDMVVLFCSLRRDGKSLGQMVKEELNTMAGVVALAAILAILVILLAVLALVVVKALAESPWGVFTVSATVPIAMFMGGYLRYWRVGRVMEASVIGVVCLLLAVWGGKVVHQNPEWARIFGLPDYKLAWAVILYGLAASVLPVWLLLAPRDYLSTFMKLGTILALAVGIFLVLPELRMPALTPFVTGSGLVVAGKIFPFCFITIACGAISGFHTLIASGTTPKLITREAYARPIGYGAMCLESLVAIMALIAACTLQPGIYFGMNVATAGSDSPTRAAQINQKLQSAGAPFLVEARMMDELAGKVNEKTLFNRAGGAATLAVGMANIFSNATSGRWLDLWYHFAIMFEALFILTTIDAGTRVGRYLLQDALGQIWEPFGHTRSLSANFFASVLMVGAWGYFLIQGVLDPHGGINSLWPLFGIANQMLAGIALCLATTIIIKMSLCRVETAPSIVGETGSGGSARATRPRLVLTSLITLVPLGWLLAVTFTAGVQKIWHADPRVGFLAQAKALELARPGLEERLAVATAAGAQSEKGAAAEALQTNRTLHFNNLLDAVVAGTLLLLVLIVVALSLREWLLLFGRFKPPQLRETEAVWLAERAVAGPGRLRVAGIATLGLALAKELSGEAQLNRAQLSSAAHECRENGSARASSTAQASEAKISERIYLETTERRFNGVSRCC